MDNGGESYDNDDDSNEFASGSRCQDNWTGSDSDGEVSGSDGDYTVDGAGDDTDE